jgi:hypothetical protein
MENADLRMKQVQRAPGFRASAQSIFKKTGGKIVYSEYIKNI